MLDSQVEPTVSARVWRLNPFNDLSKGQASGCLGLQPILQTQSCAQAMSFPMVIIAEWAQRRIPAAFERKLNASGLIYVAPGRRGWSTTKQSYTKPHVSGVFGILRSSQNALRILTVRLGA